MVETPPRYCAAPFILNAPIDAELLLSTAEENQPSKRLKKAPIFDVSLANFVAVGRASLC